MPDTREKLIEALTNDDCPLLWIQGEIGNLADHLIANGVTIKKCNRDCANCFKTKLVNRPAEQEWIPVAEGMPEERESIVRGLGTISKPVLVTWVDPTSDKPFPDDRFVREGVTRNGEFTISHINGDLVPVAWKPLPTPYKSASEVIEAWNRRADDAL